MTINTNKIFDSIKNNFNKPQSKIEFIIIEAINDSVD